MSGRRLTYGLCQNSRYIPGIIDGQDIQPIPIKIKKDTVHSEIKGHLDEVFDLCFENKKHIVGKVESIQLVGKSIKHNFIKFSKISEID